MAEPEIYWEGASGKKYGYWIHKTGTTFEDEAGNYIYAKESSPKRWRPVYIGETGSLLNRLSDHEKEPCATRNGATHIHAHTSPNNDSGCRVEESDLIEKWNPVCND